MSTNKILKLPRVGIPVVEMTIVAAAHGGFMVYSMMTGGTTEEVLYAGPLDDCVEYIRDNMKERPAQWQRKP